MTRAQTDCDVGRLVAMVPVEAHLHPCEIVGVDLLAVGAQHDGGVDAFHARARRSQWLTPGDFGREAVKRQEYCAVALWLIQLSSLA